MKLNELLMCQGVARWHIVEMSRKQSVAEHSFNVACIVDRFAALMQSNADQFIYEALIHDADEVWLGDVPAIAKKAPKLKDNYVFRAIQIADKLEAAWFASHYAIGPRREYVVNDTAGRFASLFNMCIEREQAAWCQIMEEMEYERENSANLRQ